MAFTRPLLYSGLCRPLDRLLIRRRGAASRGGSTPAWARWVRPWVLVRVDASLTVGITPWEAFWAYYDPGLGRLVVLGPGGERLPDALAAGHGPAALGAGAGAARGAGQLDDPAGDPHLLAQPGGHLPGPLGHPDQRARLRGRSAAGHLHPGDHRPDHRRGAGPLRLALAGAKDRRPVRLPVAGRRHHAQQPVPDDPGGHRFPRHLQPCVCRDPARRQDLGGAALLRLDLRTPGDPAAVPVALRPDAQLAQGSGPGPRRRG